MTRMAKSIYPSSLIACAATFVLASCDPRPNGKAPSEDKSTAQPSAQQSALLDEKAEPQPASEIMSDSLDASTAKPLFAAVTAKRKGDKAEHASEEFGMLLRQWNPVGKQLREVKEVLGVPDWESPDAFGYRFDTGWGGWEWSLSSDGAKVTNVKRLGID